jgi:GNAT superfamily N-acetyltransferase
LQRAQGRGFGRQMIERNLATFRRLGSPGAHLGLSMMNMRAYGFYQHLGFAELTRVGTPTDGCIYMGIKLK